ncbi:alpha-glucan family phosphorylase [Mycobacterium sp. CVI_P3]|uniref:Alpha-glucan family phosphorylase n=1 Tax=Mycobacterium pinniadriaticum TaxID=2994102 RepID=A0ABT3SG78_9MYCO|nr:alpha-glucan family phosphorylase [Mycobacterium pinniadriaticum]MCX2932095.1 alpha-glucan family phosphorylase [Mycobacterium pinniadriaticum]MCX2938519.1 alpha-glucan family phosphorylase [Mycobacterium pinniadriaticum]
MTDHGSDINLPDSLRGLDDLALDMRLISSHRADRVWHRVNPKLWAASRNPWAVLTSIGQPELEALAKDHAFCAEVQTLIEDRRNRNSDPFWFPQCPAARTLNLTAYFSMEFGLSEALPIYAGGLGVLAGDYMKSATDLGVPVIGVGLLYQQGYFRQALDSQGNQREFYPFSDPSEIPVQRLRGQDGAWIRIPLEFPGRTVYLRAWAVNVGRLWLYLLDSNDPANDPSDRGITAQLYEADSGVRWEQEMALGFGGWRLLRELGLDPYVCHLNEGHAAFAVLERARWIALDHDVPFDVALTIARTGTVFTTHTPVAAAFDRFDPGYVSGYLAPLAAEMGVSINDILGLGRMRPADDSEPFNMAYLAIRGSSRVNGVSRLHGEVSRKLFADLFPRYPIEEVPVGYVTNGVHVPSWDSPAADDLWTDAELREQWRGVPTPIVERMEKRSTAELWAMRNSNRERFVGWARQRLARQYTIAGAGADRIDEAQRIFDPNTLTLGFARRFTEYKRTALLLHDPDRFARILTNPERPVQIAVAGKAHPADSLGKAMIQRWYEFSQREDVRSRVAFIADYDLLLAEQLVNGVDVWINTPRRPWEASGTSGMKVLVNGGLNLSELDGWWAEAYDPAVGWAIGDGREHDGDPQWDAQEAEDLYALLENDIVAIFYARNEDGVPEDWMARVRESMATLTPRFSSERMVRQYVEEYYAPAAAAYRARIIEHCRVAGDVQAWREMIANHWSEVAFGALHVEPTATGYHFRVLVSLGPIGTGAVRVQLYASGLDGGAAELIPMERGDEVIRGTFSYHAHVDGSRPPSDYTPRVVPHHPDALIPIEAPQICWYEG